MSVMNLEIKLLLLHLLVAKDCLPMKVRYMTLSVLLSIVAVAVLLSGGCSSRRHVKDMMTVLIGHQVEFPDAMEAVNADQIDDSVLLSYDGKAKLVMFISPEECTTCRISKM